VSCLCSKILSVLPSSMSYNQQQRQVNIAHFAFAQSRLLIPYPHVSFVLCTFPIPTPIPNSTQDSSLQNLCTSLRCVDTWAAYSGCPVYVTPTHHEGVCFLNKQFPRSQFLLRASRSRTSLDVTFPSTINSSLSKFHMLCNFVAL
jgi:hypothetical protein